jgi:DNA-binding CsgD family transcriptional regulator
LGDAAALLLLKHYTTMTLTHWHPPQLETYTGRSVDTLSELLHGVYGAVSDESRWPLVLEAVVASLHGSAGVLFTPGPPSQSPGLCLTFNLTSENSIQWVAPCLALGAWTYRACEQGQALLSAVVTDADMNTHAGACTDVVREAALQALPWYRDVFRGAYGDVAVGHFCLGVMFDPSAEGMGAVVVATHRPSSASPFSQQDRHWLELLLPHLSRALGLMHRLQRAQRLQGVMLSAWDGLPLGVLLLNGAGQLVHANSAARQVLLCQDGLAFNTAGLLDAQPWRAGQPGLADWMREHGSLRSTQELPFSDAFLAKREQTDRAYLIHCCFMDDIKAASVQEHAVACVVFVSNPGALVLPTTDRLMGLYGLTLAEAKVTLQLAQGLSTKEVARVLGNSPETVRSQLKRIYQKMRINSQSELVRTTLMLGQASV